MSDSNPVQESEEVAVQNRYKGARYRKWGRWVSEIRVPGTKERLWLGSYITAEAAAAAHDVATYCLRGPSSIESLNFPLLLPANVQQDMSPRSVKRAASDAGMAMDAQMIMILKMCDPLAQDVNANENNAGQGIQQQELGNE